MNSFPDTNNANQGLNFLDLVTKYRFFCIFAEKNKYELSKMQISKQS